jgi:hypothetical protein
MWPHPFKCIAQVTAPAHAMKEEARYVREKVKGFLGKG